MVKEFHPNLKQTSFLQNVE